MEGAECEGNGDGEQGLGCICMGADDEGVDGATAADVGDMDDVVGEVAGTNDEALDSCCVVSLGGIARSGRCPQRAGNVLYTEASSRARC